MIVDFKPDGIHTVKPEQISRHKYEEIGVYQNVTVQVLRCKDCGDISLAWMRQDNTEIVFEKEDI